MKGKTGYGEYIRKEKEESICLNIAMLHLCPPLFSQTLITAKTHDIL